jgi:hypothetical protein
MYQNNYTNFANPLMPPHTEVVRVNGENGARAYNIGPNSSAILLDANDPLVWLVQTDGAGYKTITPYTIAPYQKEPEPDVKTIESRLDAFDKRLKELEGALK